MTLAQLKTCLEQARDALHRLMIGEREVSVSVDEFGATSFSQVNRKDLEKYISDLERKIAQAEGRGGRRALLVRF